MHKAGVETVTSNTDDLRTILWYKKHYNYHTVGTLKKLCSFGLTHVDHWTTLEMDLKDFFKNRQAMAERKNNYIQENDPAPLSSYPPLIINACLTGMIPMKTVTPYVPISVDEMKHLVVEFEIEASNKKRLIYHQTRSLEQDQLHIQK